MSNIFCVVSYNIMLFVGPPLRFQGANERSERLADTFYTSFRPMIPDVICLQECVHNRQAVIDSFVHHPYHTHKTSCSLSSRRVRFVSSGLTILSRYPIVYERDYLFQGTAYHLEKLCAKGIQYVKIRVEAPDKYIHVFNTHLQAWETEAAKSNRNSQLYEMMLFMKLLDIPDNEPVFLAADVNSDLYESSYHQLLSRKLRLVLTLPKVISFSFDPTTNQLVGSDDIKEYKKKKQHTWKFNSNIDIDTVECCAQRYIDTGYCSCCPAKMLDNVFTRNVTNVSTSVKRIKTLTRFDCPTSFNKSRQVFDLSDHYPVSMICTLPFNIINKKKSLKQQVVSKVYERDINTCFNYDVFTLQALICIIIYCSLLLIYTYMQYREGRRRRQRKKFFL